MVRYTKQQRAEFLQQRQDGESIRSFAKRVGVSEATIYKWLKTEPASGGGFEPISIIQNTSTVYESFIQIRVGGTEILISQYVKPEYIRMLLGW